MFSILLISRALILFTLSFEWLLLHQGNELFVHHCDAGQTWMVILILLPPPRGLNAARDGVRHITATTCVL